MTSVRRIQLRRTRDWRKPENTVVVARPTRWGNPFRTPPLTRRAAVELYAGLLELDGDLVDAIRRELRGRNLACWCLAL